MVLTCCSFLFEEVLRRVPEEIQLPDAVLGLPGKAVQSAASWQDWVGAVVRIRAGSKSYFPKTLIHLVWIRNKIFVKAQLETIVEL